MNYLALILLTLSIRSSFSSISDPLDSRIIGGEDARVGQFPWQAAVYVDTEDGKYFCGGSLIHSQWILTTAHCCYNARLFTIHLGSTVLQSPDANKVIVATSSFYIFPDFDPLTLENDICLIRLHLPISLTDYIKPIELVEAGEPLEGKTCIVSGWGQVNDENPVIVNDLAYTTVVVISEAECRLTYGDQIRPSMICTAGSDNEGICLGDTGGPLVTLKEEGIANEYVQIGISGFYSSVGCETEHPSGYTRLDIFDYWIRNLTES